MAVAPADIAAPIAQRHWLREAVRRHPTVIAGSILLLMMGAMALLAPYLGTVDPLSVAPIKRLRFPSEAYWFGPDAYGRDLYSRTLHVARVPLAAGPGVGSLRTVIGL